MSERAQKIATALSDAENEGWPLPAPRRPQRKRSQAAIDDLDDQMAHYGISRIRVDYFHYREFRYTNLTDAVAQAQRDEDRSAHRAHVTTVLS